MKIAFFVQHMIMGGVEKTLLRLCDALILNGHEISIYAIKGYGELMQQIPETVSFAEIPMDSSIRITIPVGGIKIATKSLLSQHKYREALSMSYCFAKNKTGFAELGGDLANIPQLSDRFDIAVNYHIHSPFLVWYLSERVVSKKKYAWIHNDFKTTGYDIGRLEKYLLCIDRFFAVADNLKKEFLEIFPNYISKIQTAHNLVPYEEIEIKGDAFFPEEYLNTSSDCKIILTVGRLEEQKGYDIAITVAEMLKEKGIEFEWFIIGEGTKRKEIQKDITKRKLDEKVHLLGIKNNPFPYFKHCDVYVQTSRHEGYVTTVSEAKVFCKPIVCTDVSGAKEQIDNGENGFITSFDASEIAECISLLCKDVRMSNAFSESIRNVHNNLEAQWLSYFE